MAKKLAIYIGFFLVLVVGFWFFLFKGTDAWKKRMPVLNYVKPFVFYNQNGVLVTEKDLLGKVTVVEYFFTTCEGICPKMNANMKNIYNKFKANDNFKILSHTCDPATDSIPVLKRYADSMQVDTKKWTFVTGKKDSLYYQARNSYLLDDPKNTLEKIEDQFIHTQFFALVDKDGKVRGQIYDGLQKADLEKLEKDIERLLSEKSGTSNFANNIFGNNPK
jgi:protein SCO1